MAAMSISQTSQFLAIDRPDSRVSLALSDTTYHSFQDIELYEPEAPSEPSPMPVVCPSPLPSSQTEEEMSPPEMRRQDSGYESITRRDSQSSRRKTTCTSPPPSTRQRRTKVPAQRVARAPRPRNGRHSVSMHGSSRSLSQQLQQPVTYFHFPHFTSSDPALVESERGIDLHPTRDFASKANHALAVEAHAYPLPPQTTHYWTSDRTRRLEYAAIDAASKGVRGWVMRHVVPECFVPQSKRRIGFEDDRGSVVRYRLELDSETSTERAESVRTRGWKGWWFSMRRR